MLEVVYYKDTMRARLARLFERIAYGYEAVQAYGDYYGAPSMKFGFKNELAKNIYDEWYKDKLRPMEKTLYKIKNTMSKYPLFGWIAHVNDDANSRRNDFIRLANIGIHIPNVEEFSGQQLRMLSMIAEKHGHLEKGFINPELSAVDMKLASHRWNINGMDELSHDFIVGNRQHRILKALDEFCVDIMHLKPLDDYRITDEKMINELNEIHFPEVKDVAMEETVEKEPEPVHQSLADQVTRFETMRDEHNSMSAPSRGRNDRDKGNYERV